MASLDDYSLDPLQIEEDDLNRRYAAAVATRLRASQPREAWDIAGAGIAGFEGGRAALTMDQDAPARRALGEKFQSSLADALRGAPPEIAALVSNPGTRKEGLALLQKHHEMRQSDEELTKFMPGQKFGGALPTTVSALGGGDTPSPSPSVGGINRETATRMLGSSDKSIRERAKDILGQLNEYEKPRDPTHTTRIGPSGQSETIPGSINNLRASIEAGAHGRDKMIEVMDPNNPGYRIQVPEQEWLRNNRKDSVTPLVNGPPPPPVAAPSPMPASGPISPASGQNSPPSGALPLSTGRAQFNAQAAAGGYPEGKVPPPVQGQRNALALAVWTKELQDEMPKAQAGDPIAQRNVAALQQQIAQATGQRVAPQAGPAPQAGTAPAPQAGPAPVPAGKPQGPQDFLDPQQRIVPAGNNPQLQDQYKTQVTNQQMQMTKLAESNQTAPEVMFKLDQLDKLIEAPTSHGVVKRGINWLGQNVGSALPGASQVANPEYVNTRDLQGKLSGLAIPLAKLLGVNPTEADFQHTLEQFPGVDEDAATRRQKFEGIKEIARNRLEYITFAQQAVNQGYPVTNTQDAFLKWKAYQKSQQAPGNPTQAGGSQSAAPASALPSAVSAAQANPAAYPQGQDMPGRGGNGPVMGFLSDPQSWQGMNQNAGNIARQFTEPGQSAIGPAAVDSAVNFARGAGGLLNIGGQGNRDRGAAAEAQQQERMKTDENYRIARPFTDITAVPTSYVAGATIPKIMAAATLQGATQLKPTQQEQFSAAGQSALLGFGLGLVSKLIPSGEISKVLERDLKRFPELNPGGAQINPDTLESRFAAAFGVNRAGDSAAQKALSNELRDATGIPRDSAIDYVSLAKARQDAVDALDIVFSPKFNGMPIRAVRVGTNEQAALKQAWDKAVGVGRDSTMATQDVNQMLGKSPAMERIINAIGDNTKPLMINPRDLAEAWQEIGKNSTHGYAAIQVREIIQQAAEKALGPGSVQKWAEIRKQLGAIEDLKRIYSQAGGAKGENAGDVAIAKIQAQSGKGPESSVGGITDNASEAIDTLDLKNPRNQFRGESVTAWGAARDAARAVGGPILRGLDTPQRIFNKWNPGTGPRKVVEALRRPQSYTSPLERQENNNAP